MRCKKQELAGEIVEGGKDVLSIFQLVSQNLFS